MRNSPVKVNETIAVKTASSSADIVAFDRKIEERELVIDYLERIQTIITSVQWDIKNLIEIEKLETL